MCEDHSSACVRNEFSVFRIVLGLGGVSLQTNTEEIMAHGLVC